MKLKSRVGEIYDQIINHQFKMIGEKVDYKDFPEDGFITINKKKIKWYDYYQFKDQAQYEEWKEWALEILEEEGMLKEMYHIDMKYGMNFKIKKEKGQLDLF